MNAKNEGLLARAALRSAAWSERWFPDAWVFAALGVVIVAIAALSFGATPSVTVNAFGDGFWSLIPFTMQMAFVVIGGYVVATAPCWRASSMCWPACRTRGVVRSATSA